MAARVEKANDLIRDFLSSDRHAHFVDIYHPMLNTFGRPYPEIFKADSLHMNARGYAIWKKQIEPYLKK